MHNPIPLLVALAWTSTVTGTALAAAPPITALAFAPGGDAVVVGSQAGLSVLSWPGLEAASHPGDRTGPGP